MSTQPLVDPELLPALRAIPPFGSIADTLHDVRAAIAGAQVPSRPAPGTHVEDRIVPGPGGSELRLRVHMPEEGTRPGGRLSGGLLWFHGGGMVMGAADQDEPLCRHLAHLTGSAVVAVDYRLAPEHPFPAALEDGYAALDWMHTTAAAEMGFSRERIALAGESGGGCVVAGLSLLARDRGELAVSAQFLLNPMLDDRTGTPAEPDPVPHVGEFVWTAQSNRFAWDAVLPDRAGGADVPVVAAPGRAEDLTGLPPTCLVVGALDLFLGEDLRYARALLRSGVPTDLHVHAGAYHGFVSFAQGAGVAERAADELFGAVERHFRPAPSATGAGSGPVPAGTSAPEAGAR